MPLRDKQSRQGQMGFDWPAILKTLLVEIAVLVALAGAFVFYVSWSSQVAFEEFMDADQSSAAEADHAARSLLVSAVQVSSSAALTRR